MKFIKLESRGGNYLVVAENVAWLRTAENGQTNVGIIGSQPLLVVGSLEEVAAKILTGVNGGDEAEPEVRQAVPPPATPAPPARPEYGVTDSLPEPDAGGERLASAPDTGGEAATMPGEALPSSSQLRFPADTAPDRPFQPPANGFKLRAVSQRMIGTLE